uniref:PB1 domain-containing protein n=1 Tax=Salix viminalis TaxID=40686 RepID=A0A6N2MMK7_SALVM
MQDYVNRLALAQDLGPVSRMTRQVLLQKQKTQTPALCLKALSPFAAAEEMDTKIEGDDGNVERNQPTCSSTTDSSNCSGSIMHGSTSSSPRFEERKHSEEKTSFGDGDLKITVKARYREDTIRFKFDPSAAGCFQLYEEVSKRFKLQTGTFQLKYLDDEEEWVMLVSDSDLLECLEIMENVGTRSVKFLVRDTSFAKHSSSSSNFFLMGSS